MLALAREIVKKAVDRGPLIDGQVLNVGDDVELIMTHERGEEDSEIHEFAWNTFMELTALAKKMKLYGAGQDMLADAFSGNVKGMGPGVAELTSWNAKAEPILIISWRTRPSGAGTCRSSASSAILFSTVELVIDPNMHRASGSG
jgi:fructose 1,6-bisphosphate aldolase/phosphatase